MIGILVRPMAKTKGVVAAGHELTAKAAAEILEDGGNAFDACVAGLYMTFVAEAVFASPGGGGFLMARRAGSDKIALYDFFAQTPKQKRHERDIEFYPIDADFGPVKQEFHIGLGSSATPGIVPGLFAMHREFCRLPMQRLAEPAIRAAKQGFPLSDFQAYLFTVIAPILTASEGVAEIFCPRRQADAGRCNIPQRSSSPNVLNGSPKMARASSSMAMSAQASRYAGATAGRLSYQGRSRVLSRRAPRSHSLAPSRTDRCPQPAAGGLGCVDRLRPCLYRVACGFAAAPSTISP